MSIKKNIIVTLLFLLFAYTIYAEAPEKLIIGKWLISDSAGSESGEVYMIFSEDGETKLEQNGNVMEYATTGVMVKWRIDSNFDPIHFDLIQVTDNGDENAVLSIIKFIDDNTILLRASEDKITRPTEFLEENNSYQSTLTRVIE